MIKPDCASSWFVRLAAGGVLAVIGVSAVAGRAPVQAAAQQAAGQRAVAPQRPVVPAIQAPRDLDRARQVRPVDLSELALVPAGQQFPAATDDILAVDVTRTSPTSIDVVIDYSATDHSATLLLAAELVQNGTKATGSYKPTVVSPGKGQAVVKVINAVDPFNQIDVSLYEGGETIVKRRFDVAETAIGAVVVSKKSATEYGVSVSYTLAATDGTSALLGVSVLNNGSPVSAWGHTPIAIMPGKKTARTSVTWTGTGSTPNPFTHVKALMYAAGKPAFGSKMVEFDSSTAGVPDEVKNFTVVNRTCRSLDFTVDYVYQSNHGSDVRLTTQIMSGGYPVDWLKCSQPYVSKGAGSAKVTCGFGTLTTMPTGVFDIPSDQVRVSLVGTADATPFVAKSFGFPETWSLDDLSNLKATGETGTEISFQVDYAYNSSHGGVVYLSARAMKGGVKSIQVAGATQKLAKGVGTATGKAVIPAGFGPVDQLYIFMYEEAGSEFYAEVFEYPPPPAGALRRRILKDSR